MCWAYAIDRVDQCQRFIVRAEECLRMCDEIECRNDPSLTRSITRQVRAHCASSMSQTRAALLWLHCPRGMPG
jgi:hypothetical protein